jgi:hypothetical protein
MLTSGIGRPAWMKDKTRADKARKEIRDFLAGQGRIKGIKTSARSMPPCKVQAEVPDEVQDEMPPPSFDHQAGPTGFEDQIFLPYMGPSNNDFVPFLQPPPSFQGAEAPDRYPPDNSYLPPPSMSLTSPVGLYHFSQDESALVSGQFCRIVRSQRHLSAIRRLLCIRFSDPVCLWRQEDGRPRFRGRVQQFDRSRRRLFALCSTSFSHTNGHERHHAGRLVYSTSSEGGRRPLPILSSRKGRHESQRVHRSRLSDVLCITRSSIRTRYGRPSTSFLTRYSRAVSKIGGNISMLPWGFWNARLRTCWKATAFYRLRLHLGRRPCTSPR